ncbi:MAG: hypothetical protein AB1761_16735 [Pseudomonadota bacterium]
MAERNPTEPVEQRELAEVAAQLRWLLGREIQQDPELRALIRPANA